VNHELITVNFILLLHSLPDFSALGPQSEGRGPQA